MVVGWLVFESADGEAGSRIANHDGSVALVLGHRVGLGTKFVCLLSCFWLKNETKGVKLLVFGATAGAAGRTQ